MNATMRTKNWQKPKEPQPLLKLVMASTDVTRMGFRRAADVAIFLLLTVVMAGRWIRRAMTAVLAQQPLRISKAPGVSIEVFEEYRSLHEAQPLTPFLRM